MALYLLVICVGLVICFGGIYFRRLVSGLLGLIGGAVFGFLLLLFIGLLRGSLLYALYYLDDPFGLLVLLAFAIGGCVLSAWFYKFCATINAFISTLLVTLMLLLILVKSTDAFFVCLLVSLILAAISSVLAFRFYDYAHMLVTAFSGSLIACVASYGLFTGKDFGDTVLDILSSSKHLPALIVLLCTVVLGYVGFSFQKKRFFESPESSNYVGSKFNATSDMTGSTGFSQFESAAQKLGSAAAPILNDIGSRAKSTWNDFNANATASGWKAELISCKYLFIPPIISAFIVPFLCSIYTRDSDMYIISLSFRLLGTIATPVSLGVLVYLVLTKNVKTAIVYQIPFILGSIFFDFSYYGYYFFNFADHLVNLSKIPVTWGILCAASKFVRKDAAKPLVLSVTAFCVYYIVYSLVSLGFSYFAIIWTDLIWGLVIIGTVQYLFKKYHNTSIFDLSGN